MVDWWYSTDRCAYRHIIDWSLSKAFRMADGFSRELMVAQAHRTCHSKLERRFHSSSSSPLPKFTYISCEVLLRSLCFNSYIVGS